MSSIILFFLCRIFAQVVLTQATFEMISFDLNLDTEEIVLRFSEQVNISTVQVDEISIQSAQSLNDSTEVFTLSNNSVVSSVHDAEVVNISLGLNDINFIKAYPMLASGKSNTFLHLTSATARSSADPQAVLQPINDSHAQQVTAFNEDTIGPVLLELRGMFLSDVQQQRTMLILVYNEPVELNSFVATKCIISISLDGNATSYVFQDVNVSYGESKQELLVALSSADTVNMKLMFTNSYAINMNRSHVLFSALDAHISDLALNDATISVGVQPEYLELDTYPPIVRSAIIDMNTTTMLVALDEPISDVDADKITIHNFSTEDGESYTLINSSAWVTESDPTQRSIIVSIGPEDAVALKANILLAVSMETTWVAFDGAFAVDASGNPSRVVAALRVDSFTPDVTPPGVGHSALDMNTAMMVLLFDEPVQLLDMDMAFVLSSSQLLSVSNITLSSQTSFLFEKNATELVLAIVAADVVAFKKDQSLAVGINSTFLSVLDGVIVDMAGNGFQADSMQVIDYVSDTTAPEIEFVSFDYGNNIVEFSLSEPVATASVNVTRVVLRAGDAQYTLTGGTIEHTRSVTVAIYLSNLDMTQIKEAQVFGSAHTVIDVYAGFVYDVSENSIQDVTLNLSAFTPDATSPTLLSFDFNIHTLKVFLVFSEPMDGDTLDVAKFVLQSDSVNATESVQLQHTEIVLHDNALAVATLTATTKSTFSSTAILCRTREHCFITVERSLSNTDVAGQPLAEIPVEAAKQVSFLSNSTATRGSSSPFTCAALGPLSYVVHTGTETECNRDSTRLNNLMQHCDLDSATQTSQFICVPYASFDVHFIQDAQTCLSAVNELARVVSEMQMYVEHEIANNFGCTIFTGELFDGNDCNSSVAALNLALREHEYGRLQNCDLTSPTTTQTSTLSSTVTSSYTSTATASISTTATTSQTSTITSTRTVRSSWSDLGVLLRENVCAIFVA